MTSVRNTGVAAAEDDLLDAARGCLQAVGWRRATLTDVARRAGVSRMTIYRRWPDMTALMGDLMTREWAQLGAAAALTPHAAASGPAALAAAVVQAATALRDNELFRKVVEVDPEILLPYVLDRRGRTQDALLDVLEHAIRAGQAQQTIRAGDPVALARTVVLATHGFVLSGATMTDPVSLDELGAELARMIERYLAP